MTLHELINKSNYNFYTFWSKKKLEWRIQNPMYKTFQEYTDLGRLPIHIYRKFQIYLELEENKKHFIQTPQDTI